MSISSRQLRDLESKIHEKLYENIKLLTYIHPTTKEFDNVFTKNMFAKSNKAAFQHVIYYLFTIFNSELTKVKITWPLYDMRMESTFRNEVISFINYINNEYEHANLSNLMASHLMSPGGFKFTKFMLKLSIFVMYEHLKRDPEIQLELLAPIKPHKENCITSVIRKTLKAKTDVEDTHIKDMKSNFDGFYMKATEEAEEIVARQLEIETELIEAKKLLKDKKDQIQNKSTADVIIKLNMLKDKLKLMENVKKLCEKATELLTYLSSEKPLVEFKISDFVVPDSQKDLFRNNDEILDINNLFHSLCILLENESLHMPMFSVNHLTEMTKLLSDLNEKYAQLDCRLSSHKNELVELSENFFPGGLESLKNEKRPFIVVSKYE